MLHKETGCYCSLSLSMHVIILFISMTKNFLTLLIICDKIIAISC